MSARASVRARACAKVNLTLRVLGKRADGFHELETEMLMLALADELELRVGRGLSPGSARLELSGPALSPDVPGDEGNLALRAVMAGLERAAELGAAPPGVVLALDKHVPSRAGLGGGSADAATALRLVEELLEQDLGAEWRRGWLASVGSDTVFFDVAQSTGRARCTGRGELVEALSPVASDWHLVVVTPDEVAPTGAVFAALGSGPLADQPSIPSAPLGDLDPGSAAAGVTNDLERAALAAVPGLARFAGLLERMFPGAFHMTGSGTSFFALLPSAERGRAILAALGRARAGGLAPLRLAWSGAPAVTR